MSLFNDLIKKIRSYRRDKAYIKKYKKMRSLDTDGYTLKSYDQYKCIFVHIPKNAGVSVTKSLFGNLGGGHTTAINYKRIFGNKLYDEYFKFTFSRNPWSRLYSAFNFLKKGGFDEEDAQWSKDNLSHIISFEQFVTEWLDENTIWEKLHFKPQWSFVCNEDGEFIIDYAGKIENMDHDYKYVCEKLGIGSHLEHLNSSNSNNYIDGYNDVTREKVAKLYQKDIELFDYTFEN